MQIEADVDREMRKDAKKTLSNEEVKPVDLISEMKALLGKTSADVPYAAPVQYAVQPEVIEGNSQKLAKGGLKMPYIPKLLGEYIECEQALKEAEKLLDSGKP